MILSLFIMGKIAQGDNRGGEISSVCRNVCSAKGYSFCLVVGHIFSTSAFEMDTRLRQFVRIEQTCLIFNVLNVVNIK